MDLFECLVEKRDGQIVRVSQSSANMDFVRRIQWLHLSFKLRDDTDLGWTKNLWELAKSGSTTILLTRVEGEADLRVLMSSRRIIRVSEQIVTRVVERVKTIASSQWVWHRSETFAIAANETNACLFAFRFLDQTKRQIWRDPEDELLSVYMLLVSCLMRLKGSHIYRVSFVKRMF